MAKSLENILRDYHRHYLTDVELSLLFEGSEDSRYGQVKRLLAQKKMLRLRRGLYCLTEKIGHIKTHPFELAQYIYGPSYISLESALSFHRLIPEAVHGITSVCIKRSKEIETPLGVFSYARCPVTNFYTSVELVTENHGQFFMAKPWKAICDYVFCYKKNWGQLDPLFLSLRIDPDDLSILCDDEMERLDNYYQHRRLSLFLSIVQREFNTYKRMQIV